MYDGMKDEKNVFYEMNINTSNPSKIHSKKLQTGEFDKNILCEDCDNRIIGAIYEKYAKTSMYGSNIKPEFAPICKNYKNPDDGSECSVCTNIDYVKMKLFLLSILWRASISDRRIFQEVSLGVKQEERIRRILFEQIMPDEMEYPILMTSFMRTKNSLKNTITAPLTLKYENGVKGYAFLINSIQFMFFVNSDDHKMPDFVKQYTMKKSGEITVLHLKDGKEIEFLRAILMKR